MKQLTRGALILALFTLAALNNNPAHAAVGVGVGTGKIFVEDKLHPGMLYELPSLAVINTGDVAADYGVGIAYHEGQEQLKPLEDWFSFKPETFHLQPGEIKNVTVTLAVPLKVEPGEYFTYLEGFPVKAASTAGETSISIAAAAKLYFTVEPASVLQGIYYRIKSFWIGNQPYTNIVLGIFVCLFVIKYIREHLNINISVNKKWEENSKEQN